MISAIREICIFMIIAQTILYFVPGDSYTKYVRVLVGMMMIMKITEPILGFFVDERGRQEIKSRVEMLQEVIKEGRGELVLSDNYEEIYQGIEEEVKKRLEKCDAGYDVVGVELGRGKEGEEKVVITLQEKKAEEAGNIRILPVKLREERAEDAKEEERLKELYGSCIGVDAGRIEVTMKVP